MATPADVLKMIKDKEVKFVDLRFTDTRGKEQHVSVPAKQFTQDKFESRPRVRRLVDRRLEGHRGVRHAADARSGHRQHRSVHGRDDAAHHLRRGRAVRRQGLRARSALARQARRGVSQVDRPRRHRVFRPRARVLHLRRGRVVGRHVGQLLQDRSRPRRPGRSAEKFEGGNMGHRPPVKGGYFPGAAGRLAAGHPLRDVPRDGADGRRGRGAPPRSGRPPASARSAPSSRRW